MASRFQGLFERSPLCWAASFIGFSTACVPMPPRVQGGPLQHAVLRREHSDLGVLAHLPKILVRRISLSKLGGRKSDKL